ncbi:uncharacterized protein LOC110856614 isoform X2 [Folsomia candida]|uniref:uncharacterized protein LOC110856614 isoform X2 n=1 Tax=Folsomia candida TaxID=158441 RepID=UPI000B9057FC|nr:uncharacterized protein LOC110856614 isoform X2 [Folsomia candida]
MKCKEENLCLVVLALGFLQTCSGAHLKVENKEHMSNNDLVAAPIEKRQNIESGTTRTSRQQRWPFIIYGGCSPYPPWKATPPQAFWGNQRAVPSMISFGFR